MADPGPELPRSQHSLPQRLSHAFSRLIQGPTRDPHGSLSPKVPPPPTPSRFISLPTQRCVEDSRALHLVAIRFQAAAGLLKPRADVRAGELLLFILSFFSCLLPWEGRRGWIRRAPKWRRQRRGSPRLGALLLFIHPRQTLLCLGQAHPVWGQPSLWTPWRPLPTDHTPVFPEASLGCGSGDLEAGKESCAPTSRQQKGYVGPQEHP